ncbi:MAG: DNA-3-methyladenine glycosylase family protein [Candidatus Thorarchaeota archaeon]
MSFRINVHNNYDLLSSLHSWIYPDIQPVPEKTTTRYFGRAYNLDDEKVALIIHQKTPGAPLRVQYSPTDIDKQTLRSLIQRTLNLRFDLSDALSQMKDDPIISHLVHQVAGIRPYMSPTPYEALIKTIIQQQISYRSANLFTKRMVLGLTDPVYFENQNWYHFPDAKTITTTGVDGLREFGFGYKVDYIHRAAFLVDNGEIDLDSLVGIPYKEVYAALKPIHGIGDWTIRVLSLAGLGNFSVFAYNDLVIQRILGQLYNNSKRMNAKEVQNLAQKWGDSGSIVLYLLMCAEVLGFLKT